MIKDSVVYNILHDNDDDNDYYVIVRSFNNSPLLNVILENKEKYPQGIDINSIEYNFSEWCEWCECGSRCLNDDHEFIWYNLRY